MKSTSNKRPLRVLVIDDEALIRRSVARAFRMRGAEAEEASDGEEGLRLISESGRYDIILIDMLMPGPNGSEVIETAIERKLLTHNPIVYLMSAFSGQDGDAIAKKLKIQGFIAKPFDDVFEIVDTAIKLREKGSGASPQHEG